MNNNQQSSSKDQEIKEELSKVAVNPKQNFIILGFLGILVFAFIYYNFLYDDHAQEKKAEAVIEKPVEIIRANTDDNLEAVTEQKSLPEPPKLVEPKISAPPPPPQIAEKLPEPEKTSPPSPPVEKVELPPMPTLNQVVQAPPPPAIPIMGEASRREIEEKQKRKDAKRTSSIMLISASAEVEVEKPNTAKTNITSDDPDTYVIFRGKIIDAVLETAVNSDLPGTIKAVISHDIYADDDSSVLLIPRGAKIFGTVSSSSMNMGRLMIKWERINLDDNSYLNIAEATIDNLGRGGIQGRLDNRYLEKMTGAIFNTAFNIGTAHVLDSIVPPTTTTATAENVNLANTIATNAKAKLDEVNTKAISAPASSESFYQLGSQELCNSTILLYGTKFPTLTNNLMVQCNSISNTSITEPEKAKFNTLYNLINTQNLTLISANSGESSSTKAQEAAKTGFEDITKVGSSMIQQGELKPVITLNQGTAIRIFVSQDYFFPKKVLNKKGLIIN